nr:unnamed protein product [Callosobruchus analis]
MEIYSSSLSAFWGTMGSGIKSNTKLPSHLSSFVQSSRLNPLTPAHFLLGQQSNCLREIDVRTIPTNRLTVYRHLQQIKQHIWQRWCKEYVSELQQRTKWKRTQGSLQQGALVLIKEDNVPPMNWQLGRVVNLHQGKDAVIRVATVNTQSGLLKRSFAKLCPLPIDSNIVYTCD